MGNWKLLLQNGRKEGGMGVVCSVHPGNNLLSLQSPVAAKKEKKVSCMFIPDGRVSVSAQIDRKGFCEGESLFCLREEGRVGGTRSSCVERRGVGASEQLRWASMPQGKSSDLPKWSTLFPAQVTTSASMPTSRIRAPALWCPRQPSSPSTPTWPMDRPRFSPRNSPASEATTSSRACLSPGGVKPSASRSSNLPSWAATSCVWSISCR